METPGFSESINTALADNLVEKHRGEKLLICNFDGVARPMGKENVFICGEAYSAQQGWVEGAFCVAENMLQEHFGRKRPEWLEESYYLGW